MLQTIEQLLKAHLVDGKPAFPVVEGALSVALAMKDGLNRPREVYVVPHATDYQTGTQDLGPLLQVGKAGFGVAVGLKAVDDPQGKKSSKRLDEVKTDLLAALLGKCPTPDSDPIELVRIAPIGVKDNAVWLLFSFKTTVREYQGAL